VQVAVASRLTSSWLWVRRWGISLASFASGIATLFVFRRGLPHVALIVGYLLLLWLIFAVLVELRHALESRGRRRIVTAADYTVQSLYHALLLFVLPAYWASTTLGSVNAIFLLVLAVLVLLATFDPWYQAAVRPRPWLGLVFFVISVFAALNVALPLVGVRPDVGLLFAAWASTLALAPVARRAAALSWFGAFVTVALAGVVSAAFAFAVRAAIPPAPLSLARATLARDVRDHEPVEPLAPRVSARDLGADAAIVAHTAVYAPAGLRQPIAHVWRHDGDPVAVVPLAPVQGGRREGFRTYSRKAGFASGSTGPWSVDVVTTSGQLIGRLRFEVTP
jgi:hypothetical protein